MFRLARLPKCGREGAWEKAHKARLWGRQTGLKRLKKGGSDMKLDEHLITGIFLGVVVGLFYTAQLVPYTALFLIGSIVLILRYLHAR
jgi:F0F1-type ATP synthase assembly protein I